MPDTTTIKRGLVEYPFQLRPDVWVTLRLPADFDAADAVRIGEWLALLADVPEATRASQAAIKVKV